MLFRLPHQERVTPNYKDIIASYETVCCYDNYYVSRTCFTVGSNGLEDI